MRALLLVDIQNDFLPTGALPVPDGDAVVPVANALQPHFPLIVASKDWHPPDHVSFAVNHLGKRVGDAVELEGGTQALWPVHCVQGTPGADFAPGLDTSRVATVVEKGAAVHRDSYSAFFDNAVDRDAAAGSGKSGTGLAEEFRDAGVDEVWVLGLATDYCVRATALDAVRLGFETVLVVDGCRAVEVMEGDGERAVAEMRDAGVRVVRSTDVLTGLVLDEPADARLARV